MDDSYLLPIWNALAEAKRRQILELLEERPRTTSELCEFFDVSRYAVMKHLKVLEEAGLIVVKREGRKRWNIRNDRPIDLRLGAAGDSFGATKASTILESLPVAEPSPPGLASNEATSIDLDTLLEASPKDVFVAFTEHVDAWWRWRAPGALGVYLEPTVGGRFYQAFSETGNEGQLEGELLAWVTYIKRYEEIRLSGPMGLVDPAAASFIRIQVAPHENGTRLRLHHRLSGRIDEQLIERFSRQWHDLINYSLKAFVEEGLSYHSLQDQEDIKVMWR